MSLKASSDSSALDASIVFAARQTGGDVGGGGGGGHSATHTRHNSGTNSFSSSRDHDKKKTRDTRPQNAANCIRWLTSDELLSLIGAQKWSAVRFPLSLNFESDAFRLRSARVLDDNVPAAAISDLNFSSNDFVEFSSAQALPRVRRINCDDNAIRLFYLHAPLLTHLSLANNQLESVPNLKAMPKLQHLNLSGNLLKDGFSQLRFVPEIRHIDLSNNRIDLTLQQAFHALIAGLRDHEELESLDLSGNPVMEEESFLYFVLNELPELDFLNGETVRGGDRKRAKKLSSAARWVNKRDRSWRSQESFEPMVHLRTPNEDERHRRAAGDMMPVYRRDKNPITTLTKRMLEEFFLVPLNELQYPIFLDLSNSYFKLDSIDLNKFMGDVLEELDLSGNALLSVGQLHRFSRLRRLNLDNNRLRSFSLAGYEHLTELRLRNNELRAVPQVEEGDGRLLQVLDLAGNQIRTDFENFSRLLSLRRLDLGKNDLRLSLPQFYWFVITPLKRCRHLEFINFDLNPMARADTAAGLPHFVSFVVNELESLCWYHNMFVLEEDRSKAREQASKHKMWRDKTNKPEPLPDVPSSTFATSSKKKKARMQRFSVPSAMNLFAQIQADDHSLKPIPSLHRLIDDFLEAPIAQRSFEHEETQVTGESLAALLWMAQVTFEKSDYHRREILAMVVKLSAIRNESLCDYCVQIVNVILLMLDPRADTALNVEKLRSERAEMIEVIKKTFSRLLLTQFAPDVNLTTVFNMQRLLPYHDDLADECADDVSIAQSLVQVFSLADADIEMTWDVHTLLARKAFGKSFEFSSDQRELLEQYRLGDLLCVSFADRRLHMKSFSLNVFKRMAETLVDIFQAHSELADPAASAAERITKGATKCLGKLGYAGKPIDPDIDAAEQREQGRAWILIAYALSMSPRCADALAQYKFPLLLVSILEACEKRETIPRYPLFSAASKALAKFLRDSEELTSQFRVELPELPATMMRVVRKQSSVHQNLLLRWRLQSKEFQNARGAAVSARFHDCAEILLHLTKSIPVHDTGPASLRRNTILAEVMSDDPESQIAALIFNELGLQPRKGFFAMLFSKGGKF